MPYKYDTWEHVCDLTARLWPKRHKQTNNSLTLWQDLFVCVSVGHTMKHQVSRGVIPLIGKQGSGEFRSLENTFTDNHTHQFWLIYHIQNADATLVGFSLPAVIRASFVIKGCMWSTLSLILRQGHGFTLISVCVHRASHSTGFICSGVCLCPQLYCIHALLELDYQTCSGDGCIGKAFLWRKRHYILQLWSCNF